MITDILNSSLPEQLIVMIIAALPVVELRGSLPVAMDVFHMPWYESLALSMIGNLLPVPFLLLFYDSLSRLVSRTPTGKAFMERLYKRTAGKTAMIKKYKLVGLIVFVAIPLPGTGAWTGSIAAHLLGMSIKSSLLGITIGVIGAGVIVTALVLLGWIGAGIAIAGLVLFAIVYLWNRSRPKK